MNSLPNHLSDPEQATTAAQVLSLLRNCTSGPLAPLCQRFLRQVTGVPGVLLGPRKPLADFLDIESVRFQIANDLMGFPCEGQPETLTNLRALPGDLPITYVVLMSPQQHAKCYVDVDRRQLLGLLLLTPAERKTIA